MAMFQKGILLDQKKEPALSRNICEFLNSGSPISYIEDFQVDVDNLQPEEIIELARLGNIIDEYDGVHLYKKLMSAKKKSVVTVIADAVDDEPYISSQIAPTLQLHEQLVGGLRLAQQAVEASRVYIAVYKKTDDSLVKIPLKLDGIEIRQISGRYPAEQRAKKKLRYRNALVIGSCALIHLHRAVKNKRMQTTTFITVAGDCVANPTNLEVSLGMTITQVLERCGLAHQPNRVVIGGSMTGMSVIDTDQTLITAKTKSVLAFKDKFTRYNYNCIGCGRCTENCPMGLSPYYLYKYIQKRRYASLEGFDLSSCIGCGICSYNCPAKLDISAVISEYAKKDLEKNVQSKKFASNK